MQAQDAGGPAEFRQRMMEHFRQTFDVTNDADWSVLSAKITAVMDARRDLMSQMGGPGFGPPGGGGGGPRPPNDSGAPDGPRGPEDAGRFRPHLSAEAQELQTALEAKAPVSEIKAKLAKLRDVTKARQAKLDSARDDLRSLLTTRQEAAAVLAGLLD